MINLPVRGTTHDQEQRSILKLDNILPKELFIMRKEGDTDGCSDYGVDIMLELRQKTKYVTYIRSQLQLKSVQNASRNIDGTFSYSIKISTINYLMNQANSIFVIYLENEDIIIWEWVSEIFQLIKDSSVDIGSTKQESFTYRFTKKLDRQSCEDIHATILDRGQMFRKVSEFITQTSNPEEFEAVILLKNGKTHNIAEIAKAIRQGGFALVNSGQAALVNGIIDTLPPYFKTDPEIALVYSYVKFHLGFIVDALSWLPKGSLREKLSSDKKALVYFIEIHLNFSLGSLSKEQYVEKLLAMENEYGDSALGLQVKLERIRRSIGTRNADGTRINTLLEMDETARELLKKAKSSPTRIFAEIFVWEVEGWKLMSDMAADISMHKMRFKVGHPLPLQKRIELGISLVERNRAWGKKYNQLLKQSKDRPVIYGQIVISASRIMLRIIAQERIDKDKKPFDDTAILTNIFDNIVALYPQLLKNGLHSLALTGKLLEADIFEGLGKKEKAKAISQEVLNESLALGLNDIQVLAQDLLSDCGIFASVEKIKTECSIPNDEILLNTPDEDIPQLASYFLVAMGLPDARLENIIKDYIWFKKDAEYRKLVCKHLNTLQNLTHSKFTVTMYEIDPPRKFDCMKYQYRSDRESTNRDNLLKSFVLNHCDKCHDRT